MDISTQECERFSEVIKMLEITFMGILYKIILVDPGINVHFLRSMMKILYAWDIKHLIKW